MDLLLAERIVIEAIEHQADTLVKISRSTGLLESVVSTILTELLLKNIVMYRDNLFSIDRETRPQWIRELSRPENLKLELKELLSASVDLIENTNAVKLRKIHLTDFEEKLLNIELSKVDALLKGIASRKVEKGEVKDMKVIYWGYSNYGEML